MAEMIQAFDNDNQPIVPTENRILPLTYFNLIRLGQNANHTYQLDGYESVAVVLAGNCDILVGDHTFSSVGQRKDVWSGKADAVYTGPNTVVHIRANAADTEIAIAGGYCSEAFEPFRVRPEDVDMVDVGSVETHTHRQIFHILGHNAAGRAGNLLVSELYADDGCWSGYPPHKHDEEQGEEESSFEELYHYRFKPDTGFGGQIVYQPDGTSQAFMTRNGDTLLLDGGYHPTVTSPGHREYIFTILVGRHRRSLIQNFHKDHRHLMKDIPGVAAMQAKFRQPNEREPHSALNGAVRCLIIYYL